MIASKVAPISERTSESTVNRNNDWYFRKPVSSKIKYGIPVSLILGWELVVSLSILDSRYLPAPSHIFQALLVAVSSGQLLADMQISLYRILTGFILGAAPGLVVGLLIGFIPFMRMFIQPILLAIRPIPKLALLPLLIIVMGIGEASKITLIMLGVFFPVAINSASGVLNLHQQYIDVARNYGASKYQFIKTVAIPGSLPTLCAGIKIGFADALLLIVAAEMIGANSGIGYRVWMAYSIFDMRMMFVSFIMMAGLGIASTMIIRFMEKRLIPWNK
ncbi:ABC transporter permease [Paenibacillus arenosi]|uniref:ABC transporter permease n=1 Tax=Paenibacillus arenosi TaxID=2774142 RepID=A0ABR9B2Z3_9BACL|nr:ABC transporter permease [Paenibacillus arenosi]MBD8499536.1 ABC transporter permease [Paenibacillus arenosi]